MVIAYSCVLIAAVMPLILAGYAKFSSKGFDNSKPRDFLNNLQGKSQRANWAQQNSFEAFPPFAAGVIIAHISGVAAHKITVLAVAFIIFRILYALCYIGDKSSFRSLVWAGGFACVATLFVSAIIYR